MQRRGEGGHHLTFRVKEGQWLVLRRYLSEVGWWPAASAAGSLTASPSLVVLNVVALPFHHLLTPPEALVCSALTGCVTGIFIALAQLVDSPVTA